ncbi:MAG: cysteine desulfurase [Gemmatimonadetes bacterium]|nr:cysteine desulfurase [Gemmatimonadota bacterium]MBT6149197.1 cysteine desulfurase [Gemmatimonadota bacterium]MBT7860480.1 cysteine desulfurase [Gemmatimonadota bacterium]
MLDVESIRRDFPILGRAVRDRRLIYLDNAATTQKPRSVINAIERFYEEDNANIHRGVHLLSQQATFAYERARGRIATFINAPESSECIFLRGTTEATNLVAHGLGRPRCGAGDEIIITHMEHHSNIVPWQLLCEATGAKLKVVPVDDEGCLDLSAYEQMLSERTFLVAVAHASNVLGTINPIRQMSDLAHAHGAMLLVDGAQGVPHLPVDVQALGCDFYAFSGHKMFAPTGIGVLWGRRELLDSMAPYEGGGSMIQSVTLESSTFADVPTRFEAGTPDIGGAIGLAAAVDYVNQLGMETLAAYEDELLVYAQQKLSEMEGIRLVGTAPSKVAVVAFSMDDAHPHDIGTILDMEGIAVRTGHHCAQPLMARFGVPAMARASFAFYNTHAEIDALVAGLGKVRKVLGG